MEKSKLELAEEKVQRLHRLFRERLPKIVLEMNQALDQQDWEKLRSLAHNLKGVGGSYGFPEVSASAAAINTGLRNGETACMEDLMGHLRTQCDQIVGNSVN